MFKHKISFFVLLIEQASGIKVSDVTYQDIRGTTATKFAMTFDCSPKFPCVGIRLEDVKLSYKNGAAKALCSHVRGTVTGCE